MSNVATKYQKPFNMLTSGPGGNKIAEKIQGGTAKALGVGQPADAAAPAPAVDDSASQGVMAQSAADRAARAASAEAERKAAGIAAGATVTDNEYDTLGVTGRGVRSNSRRALLG